MFLLLAACSEDPYVRYIYPYSSDLKKVSITNVGYDSLLIESHENLVLDIPVIDSLQIGYIDSNHFNLIDNIPFTLDDDPMGENLLSFSHGFKVPPNYLYVPLRLKLSVDEKTIEMDTLSPTFKYPYMNAQPYLTSVSLLTQYWQNIFILDDFDLEYPYFAYRYSGSDGQYVLNMETHQTDHYGYPSGESLTLHGDSLYFDHGRLYVVINLLTGISQPMAYVADIVNTIVGLEVYNDTIYVGISSHEIHRFTLGGEFIDTLATPKIPYAISIEDDTVYTTAYTSNKIYSWPLHDSSWENTKRYTSPTNHHYSVKVRNGYLYYHDYEKIYIGYIHKSELMEYE